MDFLTILIIVSIGAFLIGIMNSLGKTSNSNTNSNQVKVRPAKIYESSDEIAYYFLNVVGEQFKSERTGKSRQELIALMKYNDSVLVEKEPNNPYDSKAIVVLNTDREDIGYIAKDDQSKLSSYLGKDSYRIRAVVSEIAQKHNGLNVRIKVNIYKN